MSCKSVMESVMESCFSEFVGYRPKTLLKKASKAFAFLRIFEVFFLSFPLTFAKFFIHSRLSVERFRATVSGFLFRNSTCSTASIRRTWISVFQAPLGTC